MRWAGATPASAGPSRIYALGFRSMTNAAKHAYSVQAPGEIQVRLSRNGEAGVVVSVRDKGKGLPENFDHRNGGLGMTIVGCFRGAIRREARDPATSSPTSSATRTPRSVLTGMGSSASNRILLSAVTP